MTIGGNYTVTNQANLPNVLPEDTNADINFFRF